MISNAFGQQTFILGKTKTKNDVFYLYQKKEKCCLFMLPKRISLCSHVKLCSMLRSHGWMNSQTLITIYRGKQKLNQSAGWEQLYRWKHPPSRPPASEVYGLRVIFKYLASLSSQIALVKGLAETLDIWESQPKEHVNHSFLWVF